MAKQLTANEVIRLLDLRPLPQEGGFYRETYRAATIIPSQGLPNVYNDSRNASTAIYFLVTPEAHSAWHILPSDEVFHFYAGDPVVMLRIWNQAHLERDTLGADLTAGQRPQCVVPGNVWQGLRLADGGQWALLGCTVAPGFDFRDFHVATREEVERLAAWFPGDASEIRRLAAR